MTEHAFHRCGRSGGGGPAPGGLASGREGKAGHAGGHRPGWSAALDRDDNEAAADLFAKNAVVTQNGVSLVLFSHRVAVLWNSGLPCTGRIVRLILLDYFQPWTLR